jgi:hypothetical protein
MQVLLQAVLTANVYRETQVSPIPLSTGSASGVRGRGRTLRLQTAEVRRMKVNCLVQNRLAIH